MELRVLRYFLVVAAEENITKAAEKLHITQPTLSRQLMQLETELGVKLFRRSNHHIILTEDGLLLKRRAQEMVYLADKTKQDFTQKTEDLSGQLDIGCGQFRSFDYVAELLIAFKRQYPGVTYQLYSGDYNDVIDSIERGIFDLGLVFAPVDVRKYACLTLPMEERWGVLVPNHTPLAQKDCVTPADIIPYPILIPSTSALTYQRLYAWFGELQPQMNIVSTGNLLYNQAVLARQGMGIVLCIDLVSQFEGMTFVPLVPQVTTQTALIWKTAQSVSLLTKAFITFAKRAIEKA